MVTDEIQVALTTLDDRLVSVLADGAIRLVRTTWLLAQPPTLRWSGGGLPDAAFER